MNHYGARQLAADEPTEDAGRWRYMVRKSNHLLAEGYCAQACSGHPTREDAEQHYTDYLLDTRLSLNLGDPNQSWTCAVTGCQEKTSLRAECNGFVVPLCQGHQNRPSVAALMPRVGSYEATW